MSVYKKLTLCLAGVGVLAMSGNAISLMDYTFPTSTTQQAYVNGTFNTAGNSIDTTQVGYNLGGSGTYWLALRSLPFSYDFSSMASFNLGRSTVEGAESEDAYDINVTTSADKYFSDDSELFGYGGASIDYRKLSSADKADDPRIDVEVGAGYGRTINATVLKQAVRMDEDFIKYGVTKGKMSDKTLLDLASIIDRESEFRSIHGAVEYRKFWYEEMEKVLLAAGVLTHESLGAIGVIRIQEVMAEPTAQRWHGWSARAGVGVQLSDYDGEAGDPSLVARLDYHRPVGFDVQFTNRTSLTTVFSDDQAYTLQNLFRFDYEVSNRIDWYNGLTINYDILSGTDPVTLQDAENVLSANLSSAFVFYLENRLSFNPELQFRYRDDGIVDATWDWAILGGITYRLK